MKAVRFRIQNFRSVDDSGWIALERVTTFVGRNESGKTSLLKALHKFNPAIFEPYDAQREFPRDRYTRDYIAKGSEGGDWPVCSIEFEIPESLRVDISQLLEKNQEAPSKTILTRCYDGSLIFDYTPSVDELSLIPDPILAALDRFASSVRRLETPAEDQEEVTAVPRRELAEWAAEWKDKLKNVDDLRGDEGKALLNDLRGEAESQSIPQIADFVKALQDAVEPILNAASEEPVIDQINELIENNLPVLIYFENYGILDSAIWLSRFLSDLKENPTSSHVRTISAMFRHVGLDPTQIKDLGDERAMERQRQGRYRTQDDIAADQKRKEMRTIQLNSASLDISERFSTWWSQRRHKILYHADGDYFRIWVSDDRRPGVEIELESRSKGFQWFFSFYLVFLSESEDFHKNAILLLDEPGLHLHPTAQQELIEFFEKLSETSQIIYTTHSPFLIDGEHLYRVRPVTEDETGHSRITAETWPKDHETIFPLQAAAGYAMVRGLFQNRKNVLVEGMSDFYYLHALSQQCAKSGRTSLPDDIYITPCGGTKNVGHFASLFLGQKIRPLILLDGDDAGQVRKDALMKELYAGCDSAILMLDRVLDRVGQEVEIEDILGETLVLEALNTIIDRVPTIYGADRPSGRSLPSQIKAAAKGQAIDLPNAWKASVALCLVANWAENGTNLSSDVLDTAALLFAAINRYFDDDVIGLPTEKIT